MTVTRKLLFAILMSLCLSATLEAQTTGAGTITGTITDASGGVVPAAAVVVKNTATQTERTLATNEAGIFVAQFLQPGRMRSRSRKPGFAKTVRTGLTLQVGQTLTVNFALAVQSDH